MERQGRCRSFALPTAHLVSVYEAEVLADDDPSGVHETCTTDRTGTIQLEVFRTSDRKTTPSVLLP